MACLFVFALVFSAATNLAYASVGDDMAAGLGAVMSFVARILGADGPPSPTPSSVTVPTETTKYIAVQAPAGISYGEVRREISALESRLTSMIDAIPRPAGGFVLNDVRPSVVDLAVLRNVTSISSASGTFETLTVTGSGTSTFAGGIQANLLNVLSTTASSTFANGINLTGGCFSVNGSCVGAGIVSSQWTTVPAGIHYSGGNVGISSSTPSGKLSIDLSSHFDTGIAIKGYGFASPISVLNEFGGNVFSVSYSGGTSISGNFYTPGVGNFGASGGSATIGDPNFAAGYFSDSVRSVKMADGANALAVTGSSVFTGTANVVGATYIGDGDRSAENYGAWPLYISSSNNLGWKVAGSDGTAKFELYAGYDGINEMRTLNGVDIAGYSDTGSANTFKLYGATGDMYGTGTTTGNVLSTLSNKITDASGRTLFNVTSANNVLIGTSTGLSITTGRNNVFVGNYAGNSNTSGIYNSFLGFLAGYYNTTGSANAFFGHQVGYSNTTGYNNSFFGNAAGIYNTTGSNNSFIGNAAGYSNTTGNYNSFIGNLAGYSNTTGINNSFVGSSAGNANTTGSGNAFFGVDAGLRNTTGYENVFVGGGAGDHNTTGYQNSFLGAGAGYWNSNGNFNVFSGYYAGYSNVVGSGNVFSGFQSGYSNQYGSTNTFTGGYSGYANVSGDGNVFNGYQAGYYNNNGTYNVYSGYQAGYSNMAGSSNTMLGTQAGFSNISSNNVFIGSSAGYSNTNGTQNLFSGSSAGAASVSGSLNVFQGYAAGIANASGNRNTFIGASSGANMDGNDNTFVGYNTGYSAPTTGTGITLIGAYASTTVPGLTNAAAIGYNAVVEQSNSLVLGGGGAYGVSVGIGTPVPQYKLDVVGSGVGSVAHFTNSNGYCDIVPTNASLSCSSDIRLKKDVETLSASGMLDDIMRLRPVSFRWNAEDGSATPHLGFIAQEVEGIFPELVSTDAKGMKAIAYSAFVPAIVSAVQEQQKRIEAIELKLASTTSSTMIVDNSGIWDTLKSAAVTIKEATLDKLTAALGSFQRVETKQLCVDDICIGREELKRILDSSNTAPIIIISSPTPTPTDTATSTPTTSPTPTPTTAPTETPTQTPTPTPDPTGEPSPTATSSPEPSPASPPTEPQVVQ